MNHSLMKTLLGGFVAAGMLGISLVAVAQQDLAPDALARKVTDEVVAILRADKDIQSGNTRKAFELVETKVLPNFDFTRMTRLAVGAPWRQASAAQQQALTREFRTLLVNTYASALTQWRDQTIEYRPLKLQPTDTDVTVQSRIKGSGGNDPIEVNYQMEKSDQGWKVYNVIIAGVSMVENYRSSFNSEIQKNGVDGLIASLTAKNKTLGQQTAKK